MLGTVNNLIFSWLRSLYNNATFIDVGGTYRPLIILRWWGPIYYKSQEITSVSKRIQEKYHWGSTLINAN